MSLTDDEKKVAYAWALWATDDLIESLIDHDIERVDDEGFKEIVVRVLNDIAQANAIRAGQHKSKAEDT